VAEQTIGAALSVEQRQAADRIGSSGHGAELVVGVACAGKTTLLQVVSTAFEAGGCRVLGTATSGQAARTLAREAAVVESRTLASLLWRLDHQRLVLDERTVVIPDEVGMTDDAHLVALTARIEAAGAKLVLVGDHHQLGAIGPGGALAALIRRHPDVVHQLTENRRQHHPDERRALAELRDGRVADAVTWYTSHGGLHAAPDRDDAVHQTAQAWAADIAAGHPTGLYAWRRANVAALNQQARAWMQATGRLSGPELLCPGGGHYRAGDHVVTLAPGADGRLVTSEPAVVAAVDVATQTLTLRTDNGHHVQLSKDQAGSDRLDYGYATTVTKVTQTVFGGHSRDAFGFAAWCWAVWGGGCAVGRWGFVEGDAHVDVDLPAVDVDFFDEDAHERLTLVEVELVDGGADSGGEVVGAVSEAVGVSELATLGDELVVLAG
jgi:hypothetical protein